MEDLYVYIGKKLRELRNHHQGKGVDQETVAKAVGTKANTVSRWESATYKPSLRDLEKLTRYFGVSISVFFPKLEESQDSRLQALMSATGDLRDDEFDELLEYARFRRARQMLKAAKKSRGRSRK